MHPLNKAHNRPPITGFHHTVAEWNPHESTNEELNSSIYANYKDIYLENSRISSILHCFTENPKHNPLIPWWYLSLRCQILLSNITGRAEKCWNSHVEVAYDQWSKSKPNETAQNPSNSWTTRCRVCSIHHHNVKYT